MPTELAGLRSFVRSTASSFLRDTDSNIAGGTCFSSSDAVLSRRVTNTRDGSLPKAAL